MRSPGDCSERVTPLTRDAPERAYGRRVPGGRSPRVCDDETEQDAPPGLERARAQYADLPRVPQQRGEPDPDEA
ncbi:hypothetical protein CHO01_36100 [Cellulomonas hominis]|uniref:Uncharacterized protein n=1 Tax=Cellulomonas hominis TaxID=156981 RepID=A0A511FIU3_9CELL|nr:hypothetical protein CHO01_36100 [Cellulomonas hominis]